jgi:hypothetical protein
MVSKTMKVTFGDFIGDEQIMTEVNNWDGSISFEIIKIIHPSQIQDLSIVNFMIFPLPVSNMKENSPENEYFETIINFKGNDRLVLISKSNDEKYDEIIIDVNTGIVISLNLGGIVTNELYDTNMFADSNFQSHIPKLATYENNEYGFSFDYDPNWIVEDTGLYERGYVAIVANLFPDSYDSSTYLSIIHERYFFENNINMKDQEMLDLQKNYYKIDCKNRDLLRDGFECYNFKVMSSDILKFKDSAKSYNSLFSWNEYWDDGAEFSITAISLMIQDGDNLWNFFGQSSNSLEFETVAKTISTFEFEDIEKFGKQQTVEIVLPSWIKNNAGWWATGEIDDASFLTGIQYLINQGIMKIDVPESTVDSKYQSGFEEPMSKIPSWIKQNAGWWSDSVISNDDFVAGIKYLIEQGIISVS